MDGPETPIQFVKGVGPRLGAVLKNRGIETVRDLLHFFPRAYEDRSRLVSVAELTDGEKASVAVRVVSLKKIPIRRTGKTILEVRCEDSSGSLSLKWFHSPRGMDARFTPGTQLIAIGVPKLYMSRPEMVHPELSFGLSSDAGTVDSNQPNVGRVVPVYTELEGVPSRTLRKILWEALQKYGDSLIEDIPEPFLKKHALPHLSQSIRTIHFPPENESIKIDDLVSFKTPAHSRLIYEEFFKFEFLILRQRLRMERENAPSFGNTGGKEASVQLEKLLPFQLTSHQRKALQEILQDLEQPHSMNRLIQGDVGSGKTAVSFLAAGTILAERGQAVLMAPTEILAEQHYRSAVKLFGGRLNAALLTGKTPPSERATLLARLAGGEPLLLVGTHAVLEDPVQFKNLSLVMIDEQHRFGVEQRRVLRHKGNRIEAETGKQIWPHNLVLSATPIPRTLALTAYGDLAVTSIRELPPGRSPVITRLAIDKTQKSRAYEQIRTELKRGHQAYFIYPLVNESEAEGFTQLKSVVAEAERLANEVFPEFKVGLLHGQLKPDEKSSVMDRFKRGEIQILAATTVVEVGVDVQNATVIAIEHSERFGLSQLHQLRGRVGRGSAQSYCFLLSDSRLGENASQRLRVLEDTNDGFKIAEADLEIRGPGEFLGTRQAGALPFQLGNLVRDRDWLIEARDDASTLLKLDPDLIQPEHLRLRRFFEREGHLQSDRLKTS